MAEIDVNNLQDRIDVLYHVTDDFVKRVSFSPISIEREKTTNTDGETIVHISYGGGEMSSNEQLRAKDILTNIISRLANLKDPIKKKLISKKSEAKLVEQHIDDSLYICTVIDLNNAEKHCYPLTKFKRTDFNPRIGNIRKEMVIPLVPGKFTNMLADAVVVLEADILNLAGNRVYDFRELVEGAINSWEDFLLVHLADDSTSIWEKRDALIKREKWEKDHYARGERVQVIITDENNWFDLPGEEVCNGMFVRATGLQKNAVTVMGYLIDPSVIVQKSNVIRIFDINLGERFSLGKQSNNWQLLAVKEGADLKLVNDYYWELHNRPPLAQ